MRALTTSTPLHDTALSITSPQGMLLYGEVGRGKSMLLDLLFTSLPSDLKRRWHFNTFMLDVFRRLELERMARLQAERSSQRSSQGSLSMDHEHVVLAIARETVETSPILFLDEFQMPDRASSRLVNGFLTGFFGLGGVLVASSNRVPEELSRGVGVRFVDSHFGGGKGKWGRGGWVGTMLGKGAGRERRQDDTERFVDVLKARCEVWEMEGSKDWRREEDLDSEAAFVEGDLAHGDQNGKLDAALRLSSTMEQVTIADRFEALQDDSSTLPAATTTQTPAAQTPPPSSDSPPHYHLTNLSPCFLPSDIAALNPTSTWQSLSLSIYGRTVTFPSTYFPSTITSANTGGVLLTTFNPLITSPLGPADYTSIASTFHSVILTDVPVLTSLLKNEARRLIWLIDALYEAGCRLVVSAEAPVDRLFFPEPKWRRHSDGKGSLTAGSKDQSGRGRYESDSIESEAMSEMYQDSTAPFRPNISTYSEGSEWRSADPTFAPRAHNSGGAGDAFSWQGRERNVLADEDADFGPTYGNGRGHGASSSQESLQDTLRRQGMSDERDLARSLDTNSASGGLGTVGIAPDFTDTRVLVGEDERFAYKRARSRLWEMCGRRWWRVREGIEVGEWWRPEGGMVGVGNVEGRFWEGRKGVMGEGVDFEGVLKDMSDELERESEVEREKERQGSHDGGRRRGDEVRDAKEEQQRGKDDTGGLFRHGASPYRTSEEAPPKFGWQHAWGMMQWGRKAGEWGKGVDGDRRKDTETGKEGERSG